MLNVMVVDDNSDIRRLLRMALADEEVNVMEASSGAEGIEMAFSHTPDLVFLDLMMPGPFNGFDVCRRIKSNRAAIRPKVIMMSASDGLANIRTAYSVGADEFLAKPIKMSIILSIVADMLATKTAAKISDNDW